VLLRYSKKGDYGMGDRGTEMDLSVFRRVRAGFATIQPSVQWVVAALCLETEPAGWENDSLPPLQKLKMPEAAPPFPINFHCLIRC
jgi:hypothetical protein